jgi:hypothetical protein
MRMTSSATPKGYKLGIASNHADVMHWFPKHGENMDTFRKAVKKALENSTDINTDIGIGDMVELGQCKELLPRQCGSSNVGQK